MLETQIERLLVCRHLQMCLYECVRIYLCVSSCVRASVADSLVQQIWIIDYGSICAASRQTAQHLNHYPTPR